MLNKDMLLSMRPVDIPTQNLWFCIPGFLCFKEPRNADIDWTTRGRGKRTIAFQTIW